MTLCTPTTNTLRNFAARLRREDGQSLVEFAVVLPVLILIILGIVYFGRYEDYSNQETQLAETGVRWASIAWQAGSYVMPPACTATPTLQCYVRAQAQPELANGSSDVKQAQVWIYQPTTATSGYVSGAPLRVCVVSTVNFPSPIGTPSATVSQAATMRIEQFPPGVTPTSTPWAAGNPAGAVLPPSNTNCPLT